ncbi:DUF397 domain-containing protein [Streptomyces syringium]|uniref:DUF397 domain-containing protein n=1 Tax=Streptomyces syringium TaxID=76729 RepID=UPI00345275D1
MASNNVPLEWTKSTYSGQQGDCLQWRLTPDAKVEVGDSKKTSGPTFTFPPGAWTAFIASVAGGQHTAPLVGALLSRKPR